MSNAKLQSFRKHTLTFSDPAWCLPVAPDSQSPTSQTNLGSPSNTTDRSAAVITSLCLRRDHWEQAPSGILSLGREQMVKYTCPAPVLHHDDSHSHACRMSNKRERDKHPSIQASTPSFHISLIPLVHPSVLSLIPLSFCLLPLPFSTTGICIHLLISPSL